MRMREKAESCFLYREFLFKNNVEKLIFGHSHANWPKTSLNKRNWWKMQLAGNHQRVKLIGICFVSSITRIVTDGIRLQSYNHYKLCIHCKKEIFDYTGSALFSTSSNTQKKVSLLRKNEIAQSVKGNLCWTAITKIWILKKIFSIQISIRVEKTI